MQYFFFFLITLILQVTVFSFYPLAGVKPDLLLIFVFITGYLSGTGAGAGGGFFAGFIQDILLGGMFGINTFIKMIIGILSGFFSEQFYKRNYVLPPVLIFIMTIFKEFAVIFTAGNMAAGLMLGNYFKSVVLPEAIYNAILGLVIYFVFFNYIYSGGKHYV